MKKATKEWIEKAEDDYQAAEFLAGSDKSFHGVVCVHCQQCAEKYLKALLGPNVRVHSRSAHFISAAPLVSSARQSWMPSVRKASAWSLRAAERFRGQRPLVAALFASL